MLAALAASSGLPPPMPSSSSSAQAESASALAAAQPLETSAAGSSSAPDAKIGRRRSQRLSAKKANATGENATPTEVSEPAPEPEPEAGPSTKNETSEAPIEHTTSDPPLSKAAALPGSEVGLSGALVNEGEEDLHADFTDEEVDAEVCSVASIKGTKELNDF